MVGSVICFSIMDICVKWLDYYPVGQVLFLRFFIGFIPIFFIIPKDKILTIANATLPFTKRYHKLLGTLKANPQKLPSFVERDLTNEDYEEIDKEETKESLKSLKSLFDMPSKKIH